MPAAETPSRPVEIATNFRPEVFGRYFLIDRIAVGGMAEVFKAKTFGEEGFEKLLVIKRILAHFCTNDEFVRMFVDEARISARLHHPNVVQVYDFGRLGENYFIAMECVEGRDVKRLLRRLAERRRLMPVEFAAYIAHELARGLDYAHKLRDDAGQPMGIVHRDVSPSNVLLSWQGDVKIADFGIAKAHSSISDTKAGILKGKFEYMSPEQARGLEATPQSDIFAAGIVLHEMLTGRRLFRTGSDVATLEKIKAARVPPPSALNPAVPRRLDEIVLRALARDPANRFADAREMQQALHEFLYPSTPDAVRDGLARLLGELFAPEIEEDRRRLEAGTRAALALAREQARAAVEDRWEGGGTTGGTLRTPAARWPLFLAGAMVVMLGAVAALLVLVPRPVEAPEEPPTVVAPAGGAIQLRVEPTDLDVRVFVDGALAAEGRGTLLLRDVPTGRDLLLRVEAEGREPYEDTVRVGPGERLRIPVRLAAPPSEEPAVARPAPAPTTAATRPAERPAPTAPEAAKPPVLRVQVDPPGSEVRVDGVLVGRTPLEWTGGAPGTAVTVEVRRDGYAPRRFSVELPGAGEALLLSGALEKREAAVGAITVNLRSGWAKVYIDGVYVDDSPLVGHSLPAGRHTVRVRNEATGVDETRTVVIRPGQTARVVF